MLKCMPEAEKEQQQCTLRPLAQGSSTKRSDNHKRINIETTPQGSPHRMPGRVPTASHISQQVKNERQTSRQTQKTFTDPTDNESGTRSQAQSQFQRHSQHPAGMPPLRLPARSTTTHRRVVASAAAHLRLGARPTRKELQLGRNPQNASTSFWVVFIAGNL